MRILFFPCYRERTAETSYDTIFHPAALWVDECRPTRLGKRRPLAPLIIPFIDESIHPSWASSMLTLTSSSTGEQTEGLCIRCNNRGLVISLGCGSLSSIHMARG